MKEVITPSLGLTLWSAICIVVLTTALLWLVYFIFKKKNKSTASCIVSVLVLTGLIQSCSSRLDEEELPTPVANSQSQNSCIDWYDSSGRYITTTGNCGTYDVDLGPSEPDWTGYPSGTGPSDSPVTGEGPGGGGGGASTPTTVQIGKFRINPAYQIIAPKLFQTLQNIRSLVENNPKLLNSLMAFSSQTREKILDDLKYGYGPEVVIGSPTDKNGNPVIGLFSSANPNIITLDGAFINQLEHTNSSSISDALAFYLAVTLLHEYVHYGDNLTGGDYPGEEGSLFEESVFGSVVGEGNAGEILIKFNRK